MLGSEHAAYGEQIVATLSRQLAMDYGRGYSEKKLRRNVEFAEAFSDEKIVVTLSRQLSWSHFSALLPSASFSNTNLRGDVPHRGLERAHSTRADRVHALQAHGAFETTRCIDPAGVGHPPGKGDVTPALVLKDPYLLDFLGLTDRFLEHDLEDATLRELEIFLLEFGARISFVARQKRIQLDGDDFYIDLLFYNRKLKRPVVLSSSRTTASPNTRARWSSISAGWRKTNGNPKRTCHSASSSVPVKNTEQIELLELDAPGIHVAEYLTVLTPPEVLRAKLQKLSRSRGHGFNHERKRISRATGKRSLLIAAPVHPLPDRQKHRRLSNHRQSRPTREALLRLVFVGLVGNELRIGLTQILPARALAGVVIEAVLKELQPPRAFLDDLGPRLRPDRHVVIAPRVRLALVDADDLDAAESVAV